MREYVAIYGNARVTEGGAVDLLQSSAFRRFKQFLQGGFYDCFT